MTKVRRYVISLDVVVHICGYKKKWKSIRREIEEKIGEQLSRTGSSGDMLGFSLVEEYNKETKIKSIRRAKCVRRE